MKFKITLLLLASMLVNLSIAQNGARLWKQTAQFAGETKVNADGWATNYRAFYLSLAGMKDLLAGVPHESNIELKKSSFVFYLPMPDGSFHSFRLVDSPVMEKGLADAFPGIKTYAGQGIDDPTATLRCDVTQFGFHAMVISADATVFVDPVSLNDNSHYVSYFKKDALPHGPPQRCLVEEEGPVISNPHIYSLTGPPKANISGKLRTYRLALACDGEYAAYYGGTKAGALAGMVTSMNRVNGVYEREMGIHMNIIANDTLLIYLNSSTDPYTDSNGSTMLTQNQNTCNSVIGSANYDIGHVFSTGGGGIAYLGCVCSSNKARGVTGSTAPVGDAYDIDYVAHEMGHQYGANHTFNSTTGSCGGGNRASSAAYEVGSASTIMGYAGICSPNDLQQHSDDYFHTKSFDEIIAYTQSGTGNTCAVQSTVTNHAPVLTVQGNYTIPLNTPFRLTASATDQDGDPLTFCWEEYDLGNACNWNAPSGNAPIFRSFNPTTSGTRLFPKLSDILNHTTTLGEIMPGYARSLAFRCTVRDNVLTGTGVVHNDTPVTLTVASSGPFAVLTPNTTGITWPANSTQTVTWSVNNTDQAPVSCSSVNILLSTDGGQTFPFTLASGVPNNGSYSLTVPNQQTTTARIMVEGAGNIFFDINDKDFAIGQPVGIDILHFSQSMNLMPNPTTGVFSLIMNNEERGPVEISICSLTGQVVNHYTESKDNETLKVDLDLGRIPAGVYFVKVNSTVSSVVKKIIKN